MKLMKINVRSIFYCLPGEIENVTDANGYETGERRVSYSAPVEIQASVSPAAGLSRVEIFGEFADYDRIVLTDDMTCPINENTVLFIDKPVEVSQSGEPQYDYVVRRVAKSINVIAYAVKKVRS